jgi:uncharacterized protein involved in type VI secretion and phage assembly
MRTRSFYGKSPLDIIRDILAEYGIKGASKVDFSSCITSSLADFSAKGADSSKLLFEQVGQSDQNFIESLMAMYGFTFLFTHPSGKAGERVDPILYLSTGDKYPALPLTIGDSVKSVDKPRDFKVSLEVDSADRMTLDSFSMKNQLNTDRVILSAPYPNGGSGNPNWKQGDANSAYFANYSNMFHAYVRDTSATVINKDVEIILKAAQAAFDTRKTVYSGEARNILLVPGLLLNVHGVGDTAVPARIVSSALTAQTEWNNSNGRAPGVESDSSEGRVETEFTALPWADSPRFCADPRPLK